jgi:hypothetical protein
MRLDRLLLYHLTYCGVESAQHLDGSGFLARDINPSMRKTACQQRLVSHFDYRLCGRKQLGSVDCIQILGGNRSVFSFHTKCGNHCEYNPGGKERSGYGGVDNGANLRTRNWTIEYLLFSLRPRFRTKFF